VFLATSTLTLVDRSIATECVSSVGSEIVRFEPSAVELNGKVEEYLTRALNAMSGTLQVQCFALCAGSEAEHRRAAVRCADYCCAGFVVVMGARVMQRALKVSYKRYGGNRIEWLLAKESGIAGEPRCVDPAQISVLVAAIKYVEEVEEAFSKLGSGNAEAMKVVVRVAEVASPAVASHCVRLSCASCRSTTTSRTFSCQTSLR
jgi:hypothetical protein